MSRRPATEAADPAAPGGAAEEAAGGRSEMLKISELAERSGVPVATVRHYLREGLLPEPVKTSRNMAYYPPEFVERIRVIKQLQEERFMPLRLIRDLLEREDEEPERLRAMIELEDRILELALGGERQRVPADEVRERYELPKEVLDRLAELDVIGSGRGGYSPSDVRIVEATTRASASPSTTRSATRRPSSPWLPRRRGCSGSGLATSTHYAPSRSSRRAWGPSTS